VRYWREVDGDPHHWLTVEERDEIVTMGRVLAADPAATAVMGGFPEITMAWFDEESGLWVLSRPDTVSFDGSVTDYKRMAPGGKPFTYRMVDERITDHAYDMQIALAAEAFERLTGSWPEAAGIIAQSSEPPHHVILRGFDPEDLEIARFRNRRARLRFRECLDSGRWPGPGDDVGNYQRPEWQRTMLLEQMQRETAG
jgi:hypothetical protein